MANPSQRDVFEATTEIVKAAMQNTTTATIVCAESGTFVAEFFTEIYKGILKVLENQNDNDLKTISY